LSIANYKDSNAVRIGMNLLTISLIVAFLYLASGLLIPIALSGFLALLFYPLCSWLERNGFPRMISILITFIVVIALIVGLGSLLYNQISSLVNELSDIQSKFDKVVIEVEFWLKEKFNIKIANTGHGSKGLYKSGIQKLGENGLMVVTNTVNIASNLFNFLGLMPVYIFLFLLYRTGFKNFFLKLAPIENHKNLKQVISNIQKVTQYYILGLFTVMVIVAIINMGWGWILGIDFFFFFGIFSAILMILPYIGIFIGTLTTALYTWFTTGDIKMALWVVILFSITQFLEGNLITPYITGNRVKINALATIVALILWGMLWGMVGLILAIPFTAMAKVILDAFEDTKPLGYLLGNDLYQTPKKSNRIHNDNSLFRRLFNIKNKTDDLDD